MSSRSSSCRQSGLLSLVTLCNVVNLILLSVNCGFVFVDTFESAVIFLCLCRFHCPVHLTIGMGIGTVVIRGS